MNRRRFLASLFGAVATAATVAASPAPMAALVRGDGLGVRPMLGMEWDVMRIMSEEISREIDREILEDLLKQSAARA